MRYAELLLLVFAAGIALALTSSPAAAYLGPGGGLSFLTTVLAMFAAFSVSTIVIVRRQVRAAKKWLDERRGKSKPDGNNGQEERAEDKR